MTTATATARVTSAAPVAHSAAAESSRMAATANVSTAEASGM